MDAPRPVAARLIAVSLGALGALAALELALAGVGMMYRWRYERRAQPPDGRTAILCLGDSFTVGLGGPAGASYPDQLEILLNAGPRRDYRVVNAGRGNSSSAIAKSIFLAQVDQVRPRIATLMIGGANYWNYAGRPRADQPRLARALTGAWSRIRVVKLARLLLFQARHKPRPGSSPPAESPMAGDAARPKSSWTDWAEGRVRCRGTAPRGGPDRRDLAAEVVALMDHDRRATALKRVQEAMRVRPADGRVRALLGFVHWGQGEPALARESFQDALRLAPRDGYALLGMAALETQSGRGTKAFERISGAVAAAPEDALLTRVAGHLLQESGDLSGAITMLQKSLRIDPCQSAGFAALADAYDKTGQREEAAAMRQEAVRLDRSGRGASGLAKLAPLVEEGRYEEALRLCRSRGPGDAGRVKSCRDMAESLLRGQSPVEMGLMLDALRIDASDPKASSSRAELAAVVRKGGFEEAFRSCRSRCPRDPGWIQPCKSLADALARKGVLSEQARQWLRDLARLDPRNANPLLMAKMDRLQGRTEEADDLLAKAGKGEFCDAVPVLDAAKAYLTPPEPARAGAWTRSGTRAVRAALGFFRYWDEIRTLPMESVLVSPTPSLGKDPDKADLESWLRDDVSSIAAECRRRGIRLVIMNYPPSPAFVWHDYHYRSLASSLGALFVDVQKDFEPFRADGSLPRYFLPDGHCNALGNGVVARALSREMKAAGLLP